MCVCLCVCVTANKCVVRARPAQLSSLDFFALLCPLCSVSCYSYSYSYCHTTAWQMIHYSYTTYSYTRIHSHSHSHSIPPTRTQSQWAPAESSYVVRLFSRCGSHNKKQNSAKWANSAANRGTIKYPIKQWSFVGVTGSKSRNWLWLMSKN